jgi:ferredoxin--NADP+ reductase
MLEGRIPKAIADGRLEAEAGAALHPDSAQVMLCGNPGMIEDVIAALKDRGMRKHRRRTPGHITVENYW